ncbi:MAG: hypothetical protein R2747_17680 [Pyrinomonadaceae bacterium]
MLILWILFSIAAALAVWLGFWSLVSLFVRQSRFHRQFISGTLPEAAPDGFYRGTAHIFFDRQTPWLGKSFDPAGGFGFNIFSPAGASILKMLAPFYRLFTVNEGGNTDAFYFETRVEAGLKDQDVNVIKLDYDRSENPLPIRIILDEIVAVGPDAYLGKIHLKVFPGFFTTIGYFSLRK